MYATYANLASNLENFHSVQAVPSLVTKTLH